MATPLSVAVRIWAKTIAIMIAVVSMYALMTGESWAILAIAAVLFSGFLITSPLLVVISPLVKWSSRIPYTNGSRLVWLIFFLVLMYLLVITGLLRIMGKGQEFFLTRQGCLLMLSIIIVQFISVRTTRKSLYELYEQPGCSHD